nr:RHS repeat-associated core domain-containing protein [uncultured Prevotella sp.]
MATDGKPLVSVYYHDLRGQVIASKQTMPDDALLSQNMTYSFTKQPLEIISEIFKSGISTTVTQTNSYNKHNDKIETMTLKVGNVTRTVSSYSYDDIGRLVSVKRSGNAGIVKYDYNIRNWLKETKSDRFKQNLLYENTGAYPCFNGNISRMQWQTSKDNVLRGYDFAYDGLNRLEESTYSEGADMSQNKNRYSENILSYSPNGSIERLQRYGKKNNGTFGLIDDLTYSYNGNQIQAISDKAGSLLYDGSFDFKDGANASTEYFYDANGALIKDLNKGISNIEYDILGNLKCITFSNGFKTKYIYDAAGNKLRTTHESVVTNMTDYIGNFIFEDGKLDKYLFDGGYCSFNNGQNPTFHYYEKDHLGSVRMVVNENGTIEQVNHYYPFGGVYGDLSYNSETQRNKYIGKEFDHMHGLDWYDHGARMYDAAKVSWDRVDRLGEKYTQLSPYLYCASNPVVFLDADGCKVSLSGDSVNVERFVNLLNEGVGQQVFRFDHSSRTILYTASSKPNLYEKDIANIVNSNDDIIINVVSNSERVLIGDWLKKRVDVNDMESLNDYEGTSGAAAAYHELLEQNELQKYGFPTDVTSESVVKAHEYALRKEHMFLGNPKAVNLIDKDNNCIEIIDDKRTVRIPFVNFNIIRKK